MITEIQTRWEACHTQALDPGKPSRPGMWIVKAGKAVALLLEIVLVGLVLRTDARAPEGALCNLRHFQTLLLYLEPG